MPCYSEREWYCRTSVLRKSVGSPRTTVLHGDFSSPQALLEFWLEFSKIMPQPRKVGPVS